MQKKSGWPKPYPKLNLITEEVVASHRRSMMDGRSSGSSCWWRGHRFDQAIGGRESKGDW